MNNIEKNQKLLEENIILIKQGIARAEEKYEKLQKRDIEHKETSLKMVKNIINKRKKVLEEYQQKEKKINNQEMQLIEIKNKSFIKNIISKIKHYFRKNSNMQKC